ncbi:hypothetical protein GCM10007860_23880 [Chitiniphilus shinanonensis]|uniref:Transmembrane protein n=1 Tax=Chitiniphilus shinanonensis TaxID=553088 RepID=A0ABQ6BZA9_9NEIS|nr:hypothetical protein [Chitiniphilus shinanonensis]GLS05238.1 hypothetical protein GCM10007860_23880 [Chitiniphilus shinanonensis]
MYIVLIGYLYVIVMLAAGTGDVVKGGLLFLFLGFLPSWLWFWLKRQGQIKRAAKRAEAEAAASE